MEEYAIRTQSLTKIFNKTFFALNDVSINIRKGDIYGLVGRNGAGKTTLLRIVCGLASADNGTVSLNGATTFEENEFQRRKLGCIVETPSLYTGLTAMQNLRARAKLLGVNEEKVQQSLSMVGLEYAKNKKVKNFSLGMKQRLAIALALLGDPEILVLDEPVNGLDPIGINNFRELLRQINTERGTTIVVSSHYLGELEKLAHTFGIVERGRLLKEISAEELVAQVRSKVRVTLFDGYVDTPKALSLLLGAGFAATQTGLAEIVVDCDESRIPEISKLLVSNDVGMRGIDAIREDLENYFLKLVGGNAK